MSWRFRQTPDTFHVDEFLPYAPCGKGAHRFVQVRKRDLSTDFLKRRLSEQTGVPLAQMRHAGMKDRAATASQWLSWPIDREREAPVDGQQFEILDATRHDTALRIGHVASNRFAIHIESDDPAGLMAHIETVGTRFANLYGRQRFGRMVDLTAQPPQVWAAEIQRGHRRSRRLISVCQAGLFNAYLQAYLADEPAQPDADTYWTHSNGKRVFQAPLDDALTARIAAGDVQMTGPIYGYKTAITAREVAFLDQCGLTTESFRRWGKVALGARRPLFVQAEDVELAIDHTRGTVHWQFTLPSGVYATVYLLAALTPDTLHGEPPANWPDFA